MIPLVAALATTSSLSRSESQGPTSSLKDRPWPIYNPPVIHKPSSTQIFQTAWSSATRSTDRNPSQRDQDSSISEAQETTVPSISFLVRRPAASASEAPPENGPRLPMSSSPPQALPFHFHLRMYQYRVEALAVQA